jgi:hypothetical protein
MAFYNSKIDQLYLPSSIKSVGDVAFAETKIRELVIPEGMETIGAAAFAYTPLETLTLPDSVKTIAEDAFIGTNLKEVRVAEGVDVDPNAFDQSVDIIIKSERDDENIGNRIEDINGDGFVDGVHNYQIFNDGSSIDLTNILGLPCSDATDDEWDAVKAVSSGWGYKILLEGAATKIGKYHLWDVNASGVITDISSWKTTNDAVQLGWETTFGDINGDGIISQKIADADNDFEWEGLTGTDTLLPIISGDVFDGEMVVGGSQHDPVMIGDNDLYHEQVKADLVNSMAASSDVLA